MLPVRLLLLTASACAALAYAAAPSIAATAAASTHASPSSAPFLFVSASADADTDLLVNEDDLSQFEVDAHVEQSKTPSPPHDTQAATQKQVPSSSKLKKKKKKKSSQSGAADNEAKDASATATTSTTTTTAAAPKYVIPHHPLSHPTEFPLELCLFVVFVLYIVNFFYGRRQNHTRVQQYFQAVLPTLQQQFAIVGVYKQPLTSHELAAEHNRREALEEKEKLLADKTKAATATAVEPSEEELPLNYPTLHTEQPLVDTIHHATIFASGRRFVADGALFSIDLIKRQDLFVSTLFRFMEWSNAQDQVTIEIPFREENMDTFCFAVARKKLARRMKRVHLDLEEFGGNVVSSGRLANAASDFCYVTDCAELESDILDDKVCRTILDHEDMFQFLHITDSYLTTWTSHKKILRLRILLPSDMTSPASVEGLAAYANLALYLVDKLGPIRLNPIAKGRTVGKRNKFTEKLNKLSLKERQEALKSKREEELQANPELAAETRRKQQEKAEKRAMKRQGIKVMR